MMEGPEFFTQIRGRMRDASIAILGIAEDWTAPCAIYDAQAGFGEETWLEHSPDTVLAWRASGSAIACEWGPRRGSRGAAGQRLVTLQPRGTPNRYIATERVAFGQFIIPDRLLTRVGADLPQAVLPEALRDDLVFFSDDVMFGWLEDYVARSLLSPSRIEMEARAVLIVERLLSVHHGPRPAMHRGGLSSARLRKVTEFLQARLAEDVALVELAAIAELSPHHFLRAFKRSTGSTPHAWLTQRRIERAKELMLVHPAMPLIEVAFCVGYASQTAFGAAFKRIVGATPAEWRRERAR